jgi:hypothetical protein
VRKGRDPLGYQDILKSRTEKCTDNFYAHSIVLTNHMVIARWQGNKKCSSVCLSGKENGTHGTQHLSVLNREGPCSSRIDMLVGGGSNNQLLKQMAWNRDYCVGCLVNGLILGSDQ